MSTARTVIGIIGSFLHLFDFACVSHRHLWVSFNFNLLYIIIILICLECTMLMKFLASVLMISLTLVCRQCHLFWLILLTSVKSLSLWFICCWFLYFIISYFYAWISQTSDLINELQSNVLQDYKEEGCGGVQARSLLSYVAELRVLGILWITFRAPEQPSSGYHQWRWPFIRSCLPCPIFYLCHQQRTGAYV